MTGRVVVIRAHLLRHGFATHAVQVEKIPIDIVGAWMHQKNPGVTEYYSRPTPSMIADSADQYLSAIACKIDVAEAVERSPQNLKDLYNESITKTGTLAQVVGGHCVSHGLCKAQFACVGCSAKVPDPTMRGQLLQRKSWIENEISWYRNQGMLPEVNRLEQVIKAADAELHEMDLIEQYRADELTTQESGGNHAKRKPPLARGSTSIKTGSNRKNSS